MPLPFLTALANPTKHAEWVPIERCFVAGSVDEDKVWKFVKLLIRGKSFKPLVGISSPISDKIAVADGHHRFLAYKMIGHTQVLIAVSDDYAWYPIVAAGANQLTGGWQRGARRQLRRLKCWLTGEEDWGL